MFTQRITSVVSSIKQSLNDRGVYNGYMLIKTHGSESRGQEEAGLRDERVSYLQVAPL